MKAAHHSILFIFVLTAGMCMLFAQTEPEPETPDRFRSHRTLFGVKCKLSDNFTVQGFRADYFGSGSQYKTKEDTEPYEYTGWDMVPGVSMGIGELFGGIKLSVGGDIYFLSRIQGKGAEQYEEYRPRFNVFLTKPLSFGGFVQWGQRFERRAQKNYNFPMECTYGPTGDTLGCKEVKFLKKQFIKYRYRSMLKIMAPSFTPVKIAPYAYSESFNEGGGDFFSETEVGFNFKPYKGFSISLADNIQLKYTEDRIITNHLLCIYGFYTFDLSGIIGSGDK